MVRIGVEKCLEIEHEALMRCIPVLGDPELHSSVNFCNIRQLDLLVTHAMYNTTFASSHSTQVSPVPDVRTLRLLLTIAVRNSHINFSSSHKAHDITSLNTGKEVQLDYDTLVSLRDRAFTIFHKYMQILQAPDTDGQMRAHVYMGLRELFSGFLTPSPRQVRDIKSKRDISSLGQNDVLRMLQTSPKRQRLNNNPENAEPPEERESTSEDETFEEQIDGALGKFNPSAEKPADLQSKLTESINFVNHLSGTVSRSSSAAPEGPEDDGEFRMFDEPLITSRLTPTAQNKYTLWSLLEYTFYCARRGSRIVRTDVSHVDYYAAFYHNYSQFINLLVDFIQYDFNIVLKRTLDAYSVDTTEAHSLLCPIHVNLDGKKLEMFQKKLRDSTLLCSVMNQKTYRSLYLYDRVIESIFSFASADSQNSGFTCCFDKESKLLRKSSAASNPNSSFLSETYDLRYKMTYLVYQSAVVFSTWSPIDTKDTPKVTKTEDYLDVFYFFEVLSNKLASMGHKQVYYFFLSVLRSAVGQGFPRHTIQFMFLLTERMIFELSGCSSFEAMLRALNSYEIGKRKLVMTLAVNAMAAPEIYGSFADATADSVSFMKSLGRWESVRITLRAFLKFIRQWNENLFAVRPIDHNLRTIESQIQKADKTYAELLDSMIKNTNDESQKQQLRSHYEAIHDNGFGSNQQPVVVVL